METNDSTLSPGQQDILETKLHNLTDAVMVELGARAALLIAMVDDPKQTENTRLMIASLGLKKQEVLKTLLQVTMEQAAMTIGAPVGSVAFQIVFSAMVLKLMTDNEEGEEESE